MKKIKELMTPVHSCLHPESTLYDAILFMKKTKWNTVPVTDRNNKLVGVFTRSTLYNMLLADENKNSQIKKYMIEKVGKVYEDTTIEELNEILKVSRVGTGIVINHQQEPVGILTMTDAVTNYLNEANRLKGQLEKVLETSNLGSVMTDENGKIVFFNEKFVNMLGKDKNEIIYQPLELILPNLTKMKINKESTFSLQFQKELYIVRLSHYQITDNTQGLIALFQNISELDDLAQELETVKNLKSILQSVVHNAYDGLVMVNEIGEIIFTSPSIIELFNLHEQYVKEKHVDEILPELEISQVLKTGVAHISELKEIKGITYLVHRIPVYQDDHMIGAIGKIIYRQLHEVRERFKDFENLERKQNESPIKKERARFTFEDIISRDPQMEKLIRRGMKAAKGRSTIIIRGESGTGKELFAHALHMASPFHQGPFITVNCAAIPEHLLESEFFGYEAGAFTGAKNRGKLGKFELAHGGTIFLDEIGDMSLSLQAKLLNALQEKGFYRVGGTEKICVEVRIIAATNRPLEKMVTEGSFREDLFYRLNVISFNIPPLRNRKDDILLLSEAFIENLNKQNGTSIIGWDQMVEEVLLNYHWPGNIRELRNVLERAMIFAENGRMELEDLPDYLLQETGFDVFLPQEDSLETEPLLEKVEHLAIRKALQETEGNKSKASQLLGISRSVLYDKLKKYNLTY